MKVPDEPKILEDYKKILYVNNLLRVHIQTTMPCMACSSLRLQRAVWLALPLHSMATLHTCCPLPPASTHSSAVWCSASESHTVKAAWPCSSSSIYDMQKIVKKSPSFPQDLQSFLFLGCSYISITHHERAARPSYHTICHIHKNSKHAGIILLKNNKTNLILRHILLPVFYF